jgi:hypothetical protein
MTPLIFYLLSQIQFQTSDPITPDGGISAGWILVVCFAIIGTLLVIILGNINKTNKEAMVTFQVEIQKIHTRIDTREEEHDILRDKHGDLSTRVLLIEAHNKTHTETQAEHTAQIILSKLGALQGNTGKHQNHPFFKEE